MDVDNIRIKNLERTAQVTSIEAKSIQMVVGEKNEFDIMDLQTYQRMKMRFNRLKSLTGMCFRCELRSNSINVTRLEDEINTATAN